MADEIRKDSDEYRNKLVASSMIEQVEVLIKKIQYRRKCFDKDVPVTFGIV